MFVCLKLGIQRFAQPECSDFHLWLSGRKWGNMGHGFLFTFQRGKGWESLKNCLAHNAAREIGKHKVSFPILLLLGVLG